MKKLVSIIMSIAIILCMSAIAFAQTSNDDVLSPSDIRQINLNDENCIDYFGDDLIAFNEFINDRIDDYYRFYDNSNSNLPMYLDTNVAGVYTTLIQQPESNFCGPTSAYMAIQGWNGVNSIPGNNYYSKITSLASSMGIVANGGGANAGAVRDALNLYTSTYQYNWYSGGSLTQSMFNVYVFNSLAYLRAPVLLVRTNFLPYYGTHSTGHYVTVTEFDYDLDDEVCIYDPHNNDAYYGVHQVSKESAYKAIHDNVSTYGTRALICYW